jgi:hypothetical protein
METLEFDTYEGTVIIYEHPAASYAYSPALDIYHLSDERLNKISSYIDLNTFMGIFNTNFEIALNSESPIITIPYTHLMAKVVQSCLEKYFASCLDEWFQIAFFHNDRETRMLDTAKKAKKGESLEYKLTLLKDMLDFPHIKRIEIPIDILLTYPSLCLMVEFYS